MVFLLPPLFIFGWLIFGPNTIGNDFQIYQVMEALSLRFYNGLGIEPLWAPHLSGGIPYYGLAMAQAFHLPAWIISRLPGYFSGGATILFAIKGLFVLAFGHWISYFGLRKITSFQSWICYALSFISIYNLRVLDAFRYGTALDAFIYSQALIVITLVYLKDSRPIFLLILTGLMQLLMTSGYPPMLPFTGLSALIAIGVLGFSCPEKGAIPKIARVIFSLLLGVLLSAPNWLPMSEWINVNEARVLHSSIQWASFRPLNPASLISNFIRPWGAEVHSGFGASTLLGLLMGVAGFQIFMQPEAARPRKIYRAFLLAALAFPFLYSVGAVSPVFVFFYKYVPLFSSIRVPGRILIILPLTLALTLASLAKIRAQGSEISGLKKAFQLSALINSVFLVLTFVYQLKFPGPGWFGVNHFDLSPETLTSFWNLRTQGTWICLGLMACLLFSCAASGSKKIWFALIVLTFVQSWMMLGNATWVEPRIPSTTLAQFQAANHLPLYGPTRMLSSNQLLETSLGAATVPYSQFMKAAANVANCYYPISPIGGPNGILIPFYLSNQTRCLSSESAIFQELKTESCNESHMLRTWLSSTDCQELPKGQNTESLDDLNHSTRVVSLTPNLLELHTATQKDSVLVTSFPNVNSNWTALLDGKPVPILQVNGSFVGMNVPPGGHTLQIEYFSKRIVIAYRLFALGVALGIFFTVFIFWAQSSRALTVSVLLLALWTFGYARFETQFLAKAHAKVLLTNDYSKLLDKQLERWQKLNKI